MGCLGSSKEQRTTIVHLAVCPEYLPGSQLSMLTGDDPVASRGLDLRAPILSARSLQQ